MKKPIDFDGEFRNYVLSYVKDHPETPEDTLDELAEQLFDTWAHEGASWLGGQSPCGYFDAIAGASELVEMIAVYAHAAMEPPDILIHRIETLGKDALTALNAAYMDLTLPESARAKILSLLAECADPQIGKKCMDAVLSARERGKVSDAAAEYLSWECDQDTLDALLSRYPNAHEYAKMLILEVACNFPGDQRIYTYTVDRLFGDAQNRAVYAGYLAKLGDERAVEPLLRLMKLSDITYYDYMEMRAAVETLGGEVEQERTFYGDPDYEALRNL